jgi:serine/threonine protein kinase
MRETARNYMRLTSMAYDVVKALEYLSEQKYVHRDIAFRNCLVNSSRTLKLADFGMSRPMFECDYYRASKKCKWEEQLSLINTYF